MKQTFIAWLIAARLRTLPLSLSGIFFGATVVLSVEKFDPSVFHWALVVTISLQVLSNFANDLGDGLKGTDNENRIGPKRALQAGLLSARELKTGIVILILLTGLAIYQLLQIANLNSTSYAVLAVLGVLSIVAALTYTLGKKPYGYYGLGDFMVFFFFGGVAVLGTIVLFTPDIPLYAIGYTLTAGALSTAVLNLNNMRDHQSDKVSGKNTLVVRMGVGRAKIYHYLLLITAYIGFTFSTIAVLSPNSIFLVLAFVFLIPHIQRVRKVEDYRNLDGELKKIALFCFVLSVVSFTIAFLK
ncbi:MAG: 1,4-dihydroxy-2-naphthoate octaprenyltransferase [Flavobacteriaceae bacterium]|jgi:1,4-dihydroxy-2-naphthoate octaprenyltransferase|nr:1,4-dihydroxy-2-naphthoate octaprenyltransferase [Flavobacteriaceae bacterium]CAI8180642.1 MAG: 1,4-dihydroxy-2-naphthoate octaprenyltransferase [Flavobacteriaceae bacterium]